MNSLPLSPDTHRLLRIAKAGHGPIESQSQFTESVLDFLQSKYPPIARSVLSDCIETTKRECVLAAKSAVAHKLVAYQECDPPAPQQVQQGLVTALEEVVRAIMEGK